MLKIASVCAAFILATTAFATAFSTSAEAQRSGARAGGVRAGGVGRVGVGRVSVGRVGVARVGGVGLGRYAGYGYRGYRYGYGGYAPYLGFGAGALALSSAYYGGGYYDAYAYDDSGVEYCIQRFRSYDLASRTYLGYDGYRHSCP